VPNDDGYFVKLENAPPGTPAPVERPAPNYERAYAEPHPQQRRPRRRRSGFRIRFLPMVLLVLLAGLAYLQTKPGGASGQINDWIDKVQGEVQSAGANPELKRAADFFNAKYSSTGGYPSLTEEQLRDDPNTGFGIGVDVLWCSPRAIVLQSLTGSGTVSRLLLDGHAHGDVSGRAPCPGDPDNPAPWTG
jgi:hypothetical protein